MSPLLFSLKSAAAMVPTTLERLFLRHENHLGPTRVADDSFKFGLIRQLYQTSRWLNKTFQKHHILCSAKNICANVQVSRSVSTKTAASLILKIKQAIGCDAQLAEQLYTY